MNANSYCPRMPHGAMRPIHLTVIASLLVLAGSCWLPRLCGAETPAVRNIQLGAGSSLPQELTDVNGTLIFSAAPTLIARKLMRSDGTAAGTAAIATDKALLPSRLVNVNGIVFFEAFDAGAGLELYKSDGSESGTVRVRDIWPGGSSSNPAFLTNVNGTLFFSADDSLVGRELWKSNGTEAGTVLVKDIRPGPSESSINKLISVGSTLFFMANSVNNDYELWKSNGTSAGTVRVKDINPGDLAGSSPDQLTNVNGTLFFNALRSAEGRELWKSDGTDAGTVLVRDINPGSTSSTPTALANMNGTLYFAADNGVSGNELWKSDGTSGGTVLVRDINPGGSSDPRDLTYKNGLVYFTADNGTSGRELYFSDGSFVNTNVLKDIYPGATGSNPASLTNVQGRLVFTADDGVHGRELWTSTGVGGTTAMVWDIAAGAAGSDPQSITASCPHLYFSADDGVVGRELWTIPCEFTGFTDASNASSTGSTGRSQGVAWGDYDRDGDLDLFVANYGSINNLYRNDGGGTFTDVATAVGVNDGGLSIMPAWGDYDNDGDLDLHVTRNGETNRLLRNDSGLFTDIAPASGTADAGPSQGAVWGDYDRDGDLDLFVANYNAGNRLYRNDGNGAFIDVASAVGVNDGGPSISPTWGDYDNDGDLDVYVVRVNQTNRLFRNNGTAGFSDEGPASGTGDPGQGVGAAWGDYDNDGDLDLYLANYNTANRLYRNNGNGTFTDVAAASGTADAGPGQGVAWGDYDNDGDIDIFLTNYGAPNKLYRNNGNGTFTDVGGPTGTNDSQNDEGVAWADYDGDGDLDVYVASDGQPNVLYQNTILTPNRWLQLDLAGTVSNRPAIGARVQITANGVSQIREIEGGSGYGSQNSLTAEFGVGAATVVDQISIRWPSGLVWDSTGVTSNQRLRIVERDPRTAVEDEPSAFALLPNHPNPFEHATTLRFEVPRRSFVRVRVFDVWGRLVGVLADGSALEPGSHRLTWDGTSTRGRARPGVYFLELETPDFRAVQRMVMLR